MVLENWLTLSFRLNPFRALTREVAAATGFSTCNRQMSASATDEICYSSTQEKDAESLSSHCQHA